MSLTWPPVWYPVSGPLCWFPVVVVAMSLSSPGDCVKTDAVTEIQSHNSHTNESCKLLGYNIPKVNRVLPWWILYMWFCSWHRSVCIFANLLFTWIFWQQNYLYIQCARKLYLKHLYVPETEKFRSRTFCHM